MKTFLGLLRLAICFVATCGESLNPTELRWDLAPRGLSHVQGTFLKPFLEVPSLFDYNKVKGVTPND